jgi:hypothetical protein
VQRVKVEHCEEIGLGPGLLAFFFPPILPIPAVIDGDAKVSAMTIRVPLPGDQWAELRTADELTGADQDAYFDSYDEIVAEKPVSQPQPDPSNPAVMLPAEPAKLSNADARALRDRLLGSLITAWSYELPLPYTSDSRKSLPVAACNALVRAMEPMQDALTGTGTGKAEAAGAPKSGPASGTGGSEGSSPDGTGSLLPAPPAVLSGTP